MGKSVFARGFVRRLVPEVARVPSPTFCIEQHYGAATAGSLSVRHMDLYRLGTAGDVGLLFLADARARDVRCIHVIEWPQVLEREGAAFLADKAVWRVELFDDETEARRITIETVP